MKIKLLAKQIVDGEIDFVSLVKRGANRKPFAIVKNDQPDRNIWAGLMPELQRLEQRFSNDAPVTKEETPTMTDKKSIAQLRKNEEHAAHVEALRGKLHTLNGQLLRLWENPQHPLFNRLDADLSMSIEKCELELAGLIDDTQQMDSRSAFFRRGGGSTRSDADLYDSAYDRPELSKAESEIDLRDPGFTTTDPDEVSKVNLNKWEL